jgi:type IV pilus assembly protein PilO
MSSTIRKGIFLCVLLAIVVASYFLVFKPTNARIVKARSEIDQKNAMLDKLRQATSRRDDLEHANQQIRASIEEIQARLPSGKEMPEVLRQVTTLASKTGLDVPKFTASDKPIQAGLALEQQIDVEINGDFDGFYQFLLELERLPRISRIPDLEIARSKDVDGEMVAKLKLSIYYEDGAK